MTGPLCTCVWVQSPSVGMLWAISSLQRQACGSSGREQEGTSRREVLYKVMDTFSAFQCMTNKSTCIILTMKHLVTKNIVRYHLHCIIHQCAHEDTHLCLPCWDPHRGHHCSQQERCSPIAKPQMDELGSYGTEGAASAPCNQPQVPHSKGRAMTRCLRKAVPAKAVLDGDKPRLAGAQPLTVPGGTVQTPARCLRVAQGSLHPAKLGAGPGFKACCPPKVASAARVNGAPRSSKANRI